LDREKETEVHVVKDREAMTSEEEQWRTRRDNGNKFVMRPASERYREYEAVESGNQSVDVYEGNDSEVRKCDACGKQFSGQAYELPGEGIICPECNRLDQKLERAEKQQRQPTTIGSTVIEDSTINSPDTCSKCGVPYGPEKGSHGTHWRTFHPGESA
jgi:formylmethanofuran dehydrogenase subunit E